MIKRVSLFIILVSLGLSSKSVLAQELQIHHGFVFYAGKYSVDEETFSLYEDGHEFKTLLSESHAAVSAFESFETWHTMGNVLTGLSLAAFAFGGVCYMPGVRDELPDSTGVISFAAGGGLLVLGLVSEFISWSQISSAAELYNKEMDIEDGTSLKMDTTPSVMVSLEKGGGGLTLAWRF